MPPTHFDGGKVNMFWPYVVGQSGTESPEPVLVTRLPASTRRTVQPATSFANLWSIFHWAVRAHRRLPGHARADAATSASRQRSEARFAARPSADRPPESS